MRVAEGRRKREGGGKGGGERQRMSLCSNGCTRVFCLVVGESHEKTEERGKRRVEEGSRKNGSHQQRTKVERECCTLPSLGCPQEERQ